MKQSDDVLVMTVMIIQSQFLFCREEDEMYGVFCFIKSNYRHFSPKIC